MYRVAQFNIVEHGRKIVDGTAPIADLTELAEHGITALAVDCVEQFAAVLYIRARNAAEPTAESPHTSSELEVMVFRTEPNWEPFGLAGSSDARTPLELLTVSESYYPARPVFSFVSHDADPASTNTTVRVFRCHPEIGTVRQGCRQHTVADHGWVAVIVESGRSWTFIDRDGSPVGPGPFI